MSSVEVFAIVVGLWLGYLIVSHILDRISASRGTARERTSDNSGRQREQEHYRAGSHGDRDSAHLGWDEVLQIHPSASVDEIRTAYRALISKYHPDKVAALGDEFRVIAEQRTKEINAAYAAALLFKGQGR